MKEENEELIIPIDSSLEENKVEIESKSEKVDLINNLEAKWIDNQGNEVKKVFGFNENAELVNSRAAMAGFLMLILTELVFKGEPATKSIFGIGL
tara:strand:+ start:1120 stop:1404 length:285 start_codon:yes stop_codon:yes gene_type:complete